MPHPFPHHYTIDLVKTGTTSDLTQGSAPKLVGAAPPEFDGPEGHWSPEHLLMSSVGLCLWTTFEAIARKRKLEFSDYRASVEGELDKTKDGLVFTRITNKVALTVPPGTAENARKALEMAEKYCLISNALKAPVGLEANVREA